MLRSLLIVSLLAVTVVAGAGVVSNEREDAAEASVDHVAPVTPVLSARRIPALLAAPIADRRLGVALDELLARQPGSVCVSVGASGRTVYAHDATTPMIPASIAKLLTAVAVLEVLGPDHRFRTAVVAAGPPVDGVVGDVWLVGGGDPVLATAEYRASFREQPPVATPLEQLADGLVAAGVTSIDGALLGDGSRFDADRYPDSWPTRYVAQDQSGPLSALSVNDAWVAFPPSYDTNVPDEDPAADPDAHAAATLAGLLVARGTAVGSTGAGVAAGTTELAAVESPPVRELVAQLLRDSDNQTGELLLKELAVASGRPPTTVDGAAVVLEVAARLGLPMGGVVVVDGSGLAPTNQLTCDLARAILESPEWGPTIVEALPVAGQSGTIAVRFLGTPVAGRLRAKTGTLSDVTALAGALDTTAGEHVAFSWIVNDSGSAIPSAEDLARQDELAMILDRYPEGPPIDTLGPQPVPAPGG